MSKQRQTMYKSFRQDLLHLNDNDRERGWSSPQTALQTLSEYGDQLIPFLIAALEDDDIEIRITAVELLSESRSEAAMSPLIGQLSHHDRLYRIVLAEAIGRFGPKAAAGIPFIESWLQEENEYLLVTAAAVLRCLDPSRTPDVLPAASEARMKYRRMITPRITRQFFGNQRGKRDLE